MPTVVAAWTKLIVDYASQRGVDAATLLPSGGVDLGSPDARVPARTDDAVWLAASRQLGDIDLGVHLAETAMSAASLGVVGYLVRSSPTVAHALAQVQRYHRLINDRGHAEVRWSAREATVIDEPDPSLPPWPREVAELIMANYIHLARTWTGVEIVPREVRFQHSRPTDTRELERFFCCPLRFDQAHNATVLSRDVLALPLVTAEPLLGDYLEHWANARLDQLEGTTFIDEVRSAIADALRACALHIESVARRLGTTPRSLQRKLRADGMTFRALVDGIRHQRALELVRKGIPAHQIADQLGFSEARAFRRAFRRWTGLSPGELSGAGA
jgi:AraC-like DNA-binding protein